MNSQLTEKLPTVLPTELAFKVIQNSEFVNHGLPTEYLNVTLEIYVQALQLIWYVLIPMSSLGLIASFFVKHYSVRKQKEMRGELPKEESVTVDIPSKEPNEEAFLERKPHEEPVCKKAEVA